MCFEFSDRETNLGPAVSGAVAMATMLIVVLMS
jgi:hypothetical protein